MGNSAEPRNRGHHLGMLEPSPWVRRFARLVPKPGTVLDLACGGGRHARYFLALGYRVVAVDKEVDALADLETRAEVVRADLEDGSAWPLPGRQFAGIVVTNYLYRPIFPHLFESLAPGGVLVYETFAQGNERFSPPRNPDHLLKSGELLRRVAGAMQVVAYEHGLVERGDCPGVVQRICAIKDLEASPREDGEPDPHPRHPPESDQTEEYEP